MICATTCLSIAEPSPWLAVFGRCHPVLLHLPLGVLPATALLEFGALLLRRDPPRGAVMALAWLAAVTGALAATSGLVLAGEDYAGDTVGQHKVLGIVLAALLLVAAMLALGARRLPFRLALLAALGVMVPAGHLGGTLTHGADFLFQPLHPALAKVEPPPPGPGDGMPAAASEYRRTIAPFLDRTCGKCHNPTKHKGDLVLTTADGIRAGGENGPVLVAGKPDDSPLLAHCELPLDDDDHMPPKDKPQPTAAELAALRAWIAAGAEF